MTEHARRSFVIRNSTVFDGARRLAPCDVRVEEGTIVDIGERLAATGDLPGDLPDDLPIIDGAGHTLLPGLIDAHTHVCAPADLHVALIFGVTTELDMANDPAVVGPLRGDGPRGERAFGHDGVPRASLRSAGTPVTVPHGHGTENTFRIPTLTRPDEAERFVDRCIADGSDYLKVICEDGSAYGFTMPTLDDATLQAVVRAAQARGLVTVAHVSTLAGARRVIAAGIAGLAHLFVTEPIDAALVADAAARGLFVIPTLTVLEATTGIRTGLPLVEDAEVRPCLTTAAQACLEMTFIAFPSQARLSVAHAEASVRALRAAGVPIIAGTDAGNPGTAHGASLHRELELLVRAGLTPSEALAAATSVPARTFGLADRGRIAPGLRADLLLVQGDPTLDITHTRRIARIWQAGVPLDRSGAIARAQADEDRGPAGSDGGLVSDFEDGTLATRFGSGWMPLSDTIVGGRSIVQMGVVDGGANGGLGCLWMHGEIAGALASPWAGVMFCPGHGPFHPANLSGKRLVRFWARDDREATFAIVLHYWRHSMHRRARPFAVGPAWREYAFPLAQFQSDGRSLMGLLFLAGPAPGRFSLQLDDVRFD